MTEWKARRFYDTAAVTRSAGQAGFSVALDGRPVRTPAKAALVVPSRTMAEAIAAEWQAQDDTIDPSGMPVTRSANAAIDKVSRQHAEVADMLAAYAETDLLCHRADAPARLVARQAARWDPLLHWAEHRLDAPLRPTVGVLPAEQPDASLQRIRSRLGAHGPFELTALHDLVSLAGSVVIGLWVADDPARTAEAWSLSRLDEEWQIEQWGRDEEAAALAARHEQAFHHAARFLSLSRA